MPDRQASVLSSDEGEVFTIGAMKIVSRVVGTQSEDAIELYDLIISGPFTIDYHVHMTMDETLCVTEGEIEFIVDGKTFLRKAGSVAHVPRGVHHGFSNLGPGPARVLALFNPAGHQSDYTNGQRHRLSPRFRWPRKYDSLFSDLTIPWTGERHERGDCDHP